MANVFALIQALFFSEPLIIFGKVIFYLVFYEYFMDLQIFCCYDFCGLCAGKQGEDSDEILPDELTDIPDSQPSFRKVTLDSKLPPIMNSNFCL
jgi:hypothetical protein